MNRVLFSFPFFVQTVVGSHKWELRGWRLTFAITLLAQAPAWQEFRKKICSLSSVEVLINQFRTYVLYTLGWFLINGCKSKNLIDEGYMLMEDVTHPLLQLNLCNLSALSLTWFTANIDSGWSVYICVYTQFATLKRITQVDAKDCQKWFSEILAYRCKIE